MWTKLSFEKYVKELFESNDISCQQMMNYLTYPAGNNEFLNTSLEDVFLKIELKSETITIDSVFNYNHEFGEIINVVKNDTTNNIEISVSILNTNSYEEEIEEIQIDLWHSKFWYNGTYAYTTFETPTVSSNTKIVNRLILPVKSLDKTFDPLNLGDIQIPYECLIFKLKKLEKSKIPM